MIDDNLYNIISFGLKIIVAVFLPLAIVLAAAGTFIGVFQTASGIKEKSLNYLAKLLALIMVFYLLLPIIADYFVQIMELSLR